MRRLLVLFLIFILTGCASFGGSSLVVEQFPEPREKMDISLTVDFQQYWGGDRVYQAADKARGRLCDTLIERFSNSGMFGTVNEKLEKADYLLNIKLEDRAEGSMLLSFLTGFTLGMIPSCASDNFYMTAELVNPNSGAVKKIVMNDSMTTCFHLALVVAMPFSFPGQKIPEVLNNYFDSFALEVWHAIEQDRQR